MRGWMLRLSVAAMLAATAMPSQAADSAPATATHGVTKLTVEDRLDIEDALHRYSIALDNNDWPAFDQVFAPDAVLEVLVSTNNDIARYVGFKAIVEVIAATPGLKSGQNDHHTINTVIWRDPSGVVRSWSHYITSKPNGTVSNGDYLDIWRRTRDGWRIEKRQNSVRSAYGAPPRSWFGPFWLSGPSGGTTQSSATAP